MSNIICLKCENNFKFISLLKRHLQLSSRCKTSEEDIINIILVSYFWVSDNFPFIIFILSHHPLRPYTPKFSKNTR